MSNLDKIKKTFGKLWLRQRNEKINHREEITNEDVLKRINDKRKLIRAIGKRNANFTGNILRKDLLMKKERLQKI